MAAADRSDLRPSGPPVQRRLGLQLPKLTGPAISPADLGAIDAVLVGHDHHGDNLDDAGRALLPSADVVFTTPPGPTGSAATPPASAPGRPPPSETAPVTARPSR